MPGKNVMLVDKTHILHISGKPKLHVKTQTKAWQAILLPNRMSVLDHYQISADIQISDIVIEN